MSKEIIKLLRFIIFITIDRGLFTFSKNSETKQSVLLIRLDAIGDFILWLDSAKEFKKIYPERKLILCANSIWADLAKKLPYWDEVISIDVKVFSKSPIYRYKILKKIKEFKAGLSIQPTYSRVAMHGDSVIRASGSTHKIGVNGDLSNLSKFEKFITDRWYTNLISINSNVAEELNRNSEFISNLSGLRFTAKLPKIPILVDFSHSVLNLPNSHYFIIFPGSSWNGKRWPVDKFSEVLKKINQVYGWKAVLCGTKEEFALCNNVIELCGGLDILNLAGKTTLLEFIELIRGAKLLISNDTSATHIASAVSTPSVCILGGGHYGRFLPYPELIGGGNQISVVKKMDCFNCGWNCIKPKNNTGIVACISEINIDQVMKVLPAIV